MAITLVQSKTGVGTSTSLTVTLTSSTTAGNCLVVAVGAAGNSVGTVSGITLGGAAGNFASAVAVAGPGSLSDSEIWTDQNCAGGQTSVAITMSSLISGELFASVYEFSGILTSAAVDKTSTGTTSGAAPFSSGTTATTTSPTELYVGITAEDGVTGITGPSSPWINTALLGATTKTGMAGYQIVSATGTATYSGTYSGTSFGGTVVATIKGVFNPVFTSTFNRQQAVTTAASF